MLARLWKKLRNSLALKSSIEPVSVSIPDRPLSKETMSATGVETPPVSVQVLAPPLSPLKPGISDDPLDNKPWIKLAEECVELFDELDRQNKFFDPARREIADHVCCRLKEMLQRSGVELIAETALFERTLHQPETPTVGIVDKAATAIILSPGFRVGRRVLRRARVELQNSTSNGVGES